MHVRIATIFGEEMCALLAVFMCYNGKRVSSGKENHVYLRRILQVTGRRM